MHLRPSDQTAVTVALTHVRQKAEAVGQQPDTESAKKALRDLSFATTRAMTTIDAAETAARLDAMSKLETA